MDLLLGAGHYEVVCHTISTACRAPRTPSSACCETPGSSSPISISYALQAAYGWLQPPAEPPGNRWGHMESTS